jgi:hypothetical protein
MTTRIRFVGEVPATTVAGTFNTSDVSLSIASAAGQPAVFPFEVVISRTVPAKRERIRVGGLTGTTYNTITRGIDGTTAKLHDVGETVEECISGTFLDELGQILGGTNGDLYYYNGTSLTKLPIGATNEILRVSGGIPDWQVLSTVMDAVYGTVNEQVIKRAGGTWAAGFTAIPNFTSVAAAVTAGASVDGAVVYINSGDGIEGLYAYNGSNFRLPWNMQWGRVGSAIATSNQGTFTTLVDLTSLTITFTAVANRIYRVTSECTFGATGAAGDVALIIATGAGTQLQKRGTHAGGAGVGVSISASVDLTPSAGSTTYKAQAQRDSGADTWTAIATSTQPNLIRIDDMGPNGAPT